MVTLRAVGVAVLLLASSGPAANGDWDEDEEHHSEHHHSHIDLDHEHENDDFFQTVEHDEEHLKEHLEDAFSDKDKKAMTPEEEKYHFFRVHDVDQSGTLDGLELVKSLLHVNPYHVSTVAAGATAEQIRQTAAADADHNARLLKAITDIIDTTLQKFDGNMDGELDYAEYIAGAVNMFSEPNKNQQEQHQQQQHQQQQQPVH